MHLDGRMLRGLGAAFVTVFLISGVAFAAGGLTGVPDRGAPAVVETAEPSATAEPTETAEASETAEPTETAEADETAEPTETAEPEATAEATADAAARAADDAATAEPTPDDDEQGDDDQGEDEDDDRFDERSCGTDQLTAGMKVKEAELRLVGGKSVFEKLELHP